MEVSTHTKRCSAEREKYVKVRNGQWQLAGCVMMDIYMKIY